MEQAAIKISQPSSNQTCPICFNLTTETRRLKNNLVKQIISIKKDNNIKLNTQIVFDTNNGLIRLLKFVLNNNDNTNCKHQDLYKWFQSQTKSTTQELNIFSNHIHSFLAKRNYELDIILAQTRSMKKSIIDSIKNTSLLNTLIEEKQNTKMEEIDPKIEIEGQQIQQQQFNHLKANKQFLPSNVTPYVFYNGAFYSMGLFHSN